MRSRFLCTLGLLALTAASAFAQTITGTTVGAPTWNRPLADFSGLSGVGTATPFTILPFTVVTAGSYTFQNTGTVPADWDNFTFIYRNSFSAANPLVNGLIGNDDNPTIGLSGFTTNLLPGVSYFYITTGFGNTDAGAYSAQITGPTAITPNSSAPEPGTLALVTLGIVGGIAARRRRK